MEVAPRRPAVAGLFYPATGPELEAAIDRCFLDPRGPRRLPGEGPPSPRAVRAGVVPHAGYVYSGPIAAHLYAELARAPPFEEVLILGVDHHADGGPSISRAPWITPFGTVEPATDLLERLGRPPIGADERAHRREHSIEVQLPFLQRIWPNARVAALQVPFGPLDALERVSRIVADAVRGRHVLVLASTDFSHYVAPSVAQRLDRLAIEEILQGNGPGLYDVVARHNISMCGVAPTTVLLLAVAAEHLQPRLVAWGHSGQAEPMREVVGYASLLFEER